MGNNCTTGQSEMQNGRQFSSTDTPHLILNYFLYNCHHLAAVAFMNEWLGSDNRATFEVYQSLEWKSLDYRSRLADLIRNGRIGEAIAYIEQFFPAILEDLNDQLMFSLLCQQFIELVRIKQHEEAMRFAGERLSQMALKNGDSAKQFKVLFYLVFICLMRT